MKEHLMELVHLLLIELHFLHQIVHGLLLRLVMQGMELPSQLNKLPIPELGAVVGGHLGSHSVPRSLTRVVEPLEEDLAVLLGSGLPAEGLQELQQLAALDAAAAVPVKLLERLRVCLQLLVSEASLLLFLLHKFLAACVHRVHESVKIHQEFFRQPLHLYVDNCDVTNRTELLNGWLQLLPHDALYAVPDHLASAERGFVVVQLRLTVPAHQPQELPKVELIGAILVNFVDEVPQGIHGDSVPEVPEDVAQLQSADAAAAVGIVLVETLAELIHLLLGKAVPLPVDKQEVKELIEVQFLALVQGLSCCILQNLPHNLLHRSELLAFKKLEELDRRNGAASIRICILEVASRAARRRVQHAWHLFRQLNHLHLPGLARQDEKLLEADGGGLGALARVAGGSLPEALA
mmetsp:Transcript_60457/g.144081  ORF Transcript_60457/g.144081 Transcript_60457/m.144081 type:complete len:407 (+) Transcript_60457:329-1549(+)